MYIGNQQKVLLALLRVWKFLNKMLNPKMIQRVLANSWFILGTCFVGLKIWRICLILCGKGRWNYNERSQIRNSRWLRGGSPTKICILKNLFSWIVFKKSILTKDFIPLKMMQRGENFQVDTANPEYHLPSSHLGWQAGCYWDS